MEGFAVIGLGRFGSRLARNLASQGHQVIGIDKDQGIIEMLRDQLTLAVAMDATDERALKLQGVDQVGTVVLGIGDDFEAITLATVILKQMGVQRVIARATSRRTAEILARVGADDIVNPEDEAADRWANRLVSPKFLNQIEFHEGHSIVEIRVPKKWVGQTLSRLNVRSKFGIHVVAIKRRREDPATPIRIELPGPAEPLLGEDILVLMGKDEDLARLPADK